MRKPSMRGRQLWVMLVDEATKYKKSFFLKKKNEQVEPIICCTAISNGLITGTFPFPFPFFEQAGK